MRKLAAVILTLAMAVSCFTMTAAAAGTVNVPSDLQAGISGSGFADSVSIEAGTSVDLLATVNMAPVREAFESEYTDMLSTIGEDADLLARFRNCKVTGGWTLTLTYPNTVSIPASVKNASNMSGFNDGAKLVFSEVSRTDNKSGTNRVLTIQVKMDGLLPEGGTRPGYCTVGDLKDHLDTWLADMEFQVEGVQVAADTTAVFTGTLTGSTEIKANVLSETFNFTGVPKNTEKGAIRAEVAVRAEDGEGVHVIGGGSSFNGGKLPTSSKNPTVEGGDTPEGGSQSGSGTADSSVSGLNSTMHIAYVNGYEDGTVRPEESITRAEVATMLYRLLDSARRDEIFTDSYNFTDVTKDMWYNKAVSSMARGGYITGYEDGAFHGDDAITRAELVTLVSRFASAKESNVQFTDVDTNYWAYQAIATAVGNNWVSGYPNGSFCPDQNVTRAETMAIINRVLGRGVAESGLSNMAYKTWSDVSADMWYYNEIIEATNAHTYTGTSRNETWVGLGVSTYYDIDRYERP